MRDRWEPVYGPRRQWLHEEVEMTGSNDDLWYDAETEERPRSSSRLRMSLICLAAIGTVLALLLWAPL